MAALHGRTVHITVDVCCRRTTYLDCFLFRHSLALPRRTLRAVGGRRLWHVDIWRFGGKAARRVGREKEWKRDQGKRYVFCSKEGEGR